MDELVAAETPGFPSDPGGSAPAPPSRAVSAVRSARRALGVVPFGVYMALGLGAPLIAVVFGAFQSPNGGGFTLSNVKTATSGVYLHGFSQSIVLSVIASVLPGILGLLLAYAIWSARRGAVLRRVAITASAVFANFGGVPLAFLFIATLGSSGLATKWLNDLGFDIYAHGFSLYNLSGVAVVYMYFQIPLMVLVILPALGGCGRPGVRRPRTWAPGPGSTGATWAAQCCSRRSSAACCCCSAARYPPTPRLRP